MFDSEIFVNSEVPSMKKSWDVQGPWYWPSKTETKLYPEWPSTTLYDKPSLWFWNSVN